MCSNDKFCTFYNLNVKMDYLRLWILLSVSVLPRMAKGQVGVWIQRSVFEYYFSPAGHRVTWSEARQLCLDEGADLVSVHSQAEYEWIRGNMGESFYWIGMRNPRAVGYDTWYWTWSDGSPRNWINWSLDNPGRKGDVCGCYDYELRDMYDASCIDEKPFICKRGSLWIQRSVYEYHFSPSTRNVTWSEARQVCLDDGADLLSVHSYSEDEWIRSKRRRADYWIGLRNPNASGKDNLEWQWSDRSPRDFLRWDASDLSNTDEPNNIGNACGFYYLTRPKWYDASCLDKKRFICKREINECFPNLCENGATCNDELGRFSCNCSKGFKGERCQLDIDECSMSEEVCYNNATCNNTHGGFFCTCLPGFEGPLCQKDSNINKLKRYIGFVAGFLAIVFLGTIALVALQQYRKRKRKKHERESCGGEDRKVELYGHVTCSDILMPDLNTNTDSDNRLSEGKDMQEDLYAHIADSDILMHDMNIKIKSDNRTGNRADGVVLPSNKQPSPSDPYYLQPISSPLEYSYVYSSSVTEHSNLKMSVGPNDCVVMQQESRSNSPEPMATEPGRGYATSSAVNQTQLNTLEESTARSDSQPISDFSKRGTKQHTMSTQSDAKNIESYVSPRAEDRKAMEDSSFTEETSPTKNRQTPTVDKSFDYTGACSTANTRQSPTVEKRIDNREDNSSKVSAQYQEKRQAPYHMEVKSLKITHPNNEKQRTTDYAEATSSKVTPPDQEDPLKTEGVDSTGQRLTTTEMEYSKGDASVSIVHSTDDSNYERLHKSKPTSYTRLRSVNRTQ